MHRPAVRRRAGFGLLVAIVACGLGCREQGGVAAAPGKSSSRIDECSPEGGNTNPENDPPEVKNETTIERDRSEPDPAAAVEKNPLAGCQQCHVDVEDEYAASLHFKEKIACTDCHGPSHGHVADENNEVKPDEVFARKDVDTLCGKCHECSRPAAAKSTAVADAKPKVCTDCHGAHDLARATEKIESKGE